MVPTDRKYTREHDWVLIEDGVATLGITGAFRYKIKGQIIYGIVRKSTVPEKEGGRSYDEISSEVRKSIDASGCLPADLRYLNGNRICTLPGNHAGW